MIFRQLFEPLSSTYSYLLGCEDSYSTAPQWRSGRPNVRLSGPRQQSLQATTS